MKLPRVELRAPAKVNLHLGVHRGRDARGYHTVDSLMAAVALVDDVTVGEASSFALEVTPDIGVPVQKDTCYKAAMAFAEVMGREPKARIEVRKRIPAASGLGGASSDAASVVMALARLWGVPEHDARLRSACARVGADVPFFLNPVPTLLAGVGDEPTEAFPQAPELCLALVRPNGPGVSTPAAYAEFDRNPQELPDHLALCAALRGGTAKEVATYLANNLAPAACALNPAVGEACSWLVSQPGVLGAQVTGSGACSFAVCATKEDALRIVEAAEERGWWSEATHTL